MPNDLPPGIELEPLPFEEAIAFFADKIPMTSAEYFALEESVRALAFTVSRVAAADIIVGIKNAVEAAITDGETLRDFQARLSDIMSAKGWEGLTPWHAETIFRNNVQTAYSVGRHDQMMEMSDSFYGEYDAVNDLATRPAHAALDGKIYPMDHPFWDTWWPPNGHRCFPAGTEVLTSSGWQPIEKIKIDDRVIGGSGKEQGVTFVHRNFFNGNIVRLGLENDFIDTTPNHRILTMRGWVRANALNASDILVQTLKQTSINALIGNVNETNAESGESAMSLPVQGKPAMCFASDSKVEIGNKYVKPPGAKFCRYNVVMDWTKANIRNVLDHKLLRSCRQSLTCSVSRRVSPNNEPVRSSVFCSNFRASGRRAFFKLKSNTHSTLIHFLGFPGAWMVPFFFHLGAQLLHYIRRFFSSFFWSVQPLCTNGLAAFSRLDSKMPDEAHQGSGINVPAGAELPVRILFDKIKSADRLGEGAPLDCFNTLDDFRTWARFHCCLHKIKYVDTISYNGIVYNLSVKNDESYIIPGATVHNCRCSVNPVHKYAVEEEGLKIETEDPTGGLIEPVDPKTGSKMPARPLIPDPGWDHNPAKKSWKPDLAKYPEGLRRQLEADSS